MTTCFCSNAVQFYMHTFEPKLIPGISQEHCLELVNASYVASIRRQVSQLTDKPYITFVNQEEFSLQGNSTYRVTVRMDRPRELSHSG